MSLPMLGSQKKLRSKKLRSKPSAATAALANLSVLLLLFYALPLPSYGGGPQQPQPKEPLGSLTAVGEVYSNDNPAPRESTIFAGDRIRTGESGAASFAMSGKGTLKIAPQSQVLFSGNYQFTAELEAGTIALNTISGPNGLSLRVGNYVVVPQNQSATLQVSLAPNGSVFVSCVQGSAGVLTLEGKVGQFLQAGQSTSITASSGFTPPKESGPLAHPGWLLGGLGGTGLAAALVFLTRGNAGQSVSPSAP